MVGRSKVLGLVLAIMIPLVLTACDGQVEVTKDFTSRMKQVDEARSKVSNRVLTIRQDCEAGTIPDSPYCYNGRTWYSDYVMSNFNGWITEVQSDLTASKSLENITSYDSDLKVALANADAFNKWVDEVHTYFSQPAPGTGGAMGGPSVPDLIPPLVEAGVTIWAQYEAGTQEAVDRLKADIETLRFAPFDETSGL